MKVMKKKTRLLAYIMSSLFLNPGKESQV